VKKYYLQTILNWMMKGIQANSYKIHISSVSDGKKREDMWAEGVTQFVHGRNEVFNFNFNLNSCQLELVS